MKVAGNEKLNDSNALHNESNANQSLKMTAFLHYDLEHILSIPGNCRSILQKYGTRKAQTKGILFSVILIVHVRECRLQTIKLIEVDVEITVRN